MVFNRKDNSNCLSIELKRHFEIFPSTIIFGNRQRQNENANNSKISIDGRNSNVPNCSESSDGCERENVQTKSVLLMSKKA